MSDAKPTDDLTAAQLQGLLSIADDAIVCFDGAMRIVLFNHGAERIFGWQSNEVVGRSLTVIIPEVYRAARVRDPQNL